MKTTFGTLLALTVFAAVAAQAAPIVLLTEDFEAPISNNTNPLPAPTGWTYVQRGGRSDLQGLWNDPAMTNFGNQFLRHFEQGGYRLQTTDAILDATVQVGAEYTLTFHYGAIVANRAGRFTASLLAIDDDGVETVLATQNFEFTSGQFLGLTAVGTLSVTPTLNDGERLAIEFRNILEAGTNHAGIDNLQLTAIPPPPAGTVISIR